ncbi:hypothetical protein QQY66_21125 [Streptomyces sp. DG2A-72]|uniref:hypothetical protein n=1 Tax=Streptomyces sp. DG2A-72 TaxID=3051386 RepID=UPI00265C14B9|nr:hypothetical protein [Streptomyces sp. DG2A-72]MDO0934070.1 hypothetical protein [Streptomyces sp. DG2A-72]
MRIRATVAAVTGALALSAVAAPVATAAEPKVPANVAAALDAVAAADGTSAFATAAAGASYVLDASFSNVKVNSGKNVVVGTTATVKVPVSFTLTHGADVDIHAADFVAAVQLYRGESFGDSFSDFTSSDATCTDSSATVASCKATVAIDPFYLFNDDAASWKAAAFAVAYNGEDPDDPDLDKVGVVVKDPTNSFRFQRLSQLTVNAAPEPVKKGKTITITGKLTHANWDNSRYVGYGNQSVVLQFRKKGTTNYTNVKGIKTKTTGNLKTTVKASIDGYYRFQFKGTTATAPVTVAGDYVDVK